MFASHIYSDDMSTGTLPHCVYGRVMRNLNKNDCAKSLRVVLLYGEFDNVPEFSRLYTFSMLQGTLIDQQPLKNLLLQFVSWTALFERKIPVLVVHGRLEERQL